MVSARNAWNNDTPFGKRIRKEKKWLAFLEHLVSEESSNKGQKDNVVMINRARCRPVARFFLRNYGEMQSKEEADVDRTRPGEQISRRGGGN